MPKLTFSLIILEYYKNNIESIISSLKKTVVYLGYHVKDKIRYTGTGFVISIDGFFHIVTAKHVIKDPETDERLDKGMSFWFNDSEHKLASRDFDFLVEKQGVDWIFHKDEKVDIAIIPTQLDPKSEEIVDTPLENFLEFEKLIETQDIIFISYQPGTAPINQINPVIRNGIVSQLVNNKTFLIDGSAYPGNSGSPIFLKSDSLTKSFEDITPSNKPRLIGIVGAYIPYQEEAISRQTNQLRVIFQENSGLSICWSIDKLLEIIESEEFKNQFEKVKGKKNEEVIMTPKKYRDVE